MKILKKTFDFDENLNQPSWGTSESLPGVKLKIEEGLFESIFIKQNFRQNLLQN